MSTASTLATPIDITPGHRDDAPERRAFLDDVLNGLRRARKELPCKYFYDKRGSELFDAICELEEYYPTRTEMAIMRERADEMAARLGPDCLLVELGSGSGLKTRVLLRQLPRPAGYVPVDISRQHLLESSARLAATFPHIEVKPVCADYTAELEIPTVRRPPARRVVYFPGSTVGNFRPAEARRFLARMARRIGRGGALLIGVDLKKDQAVLERAYNDADGVTAAFNLNLLARINRELGADFDLSAFRHRAIYNRTRGRIEMHLVAARATRARVAGRPIHFGAGEAILTEVSYKYTVEEFAELAGRAGFGLEAVWSDREDKFSVQLYTR